MSLAVFNFGCMDYFLVQTVGRTVTGTKHMVAPGEGSDLKLEAKKGKEAKEADGDDPLPYFSEPDEIFITYSFVSSIRDLWMKEKVIWKRGRYQEVREKRVDTRDHSFKAQFPWEQIHSDLGKNWYGDWQVCLIINDRKTGCKEFYLVNKPEYKRLLKLSKQYEKDNENGKAREMKKRARRCNPLEFESE